ncbi:B12-binding domain-containing radical SAM protein [Streptomyces sp. NPDC056747]|uniref:B12-binding domain-containing radical SAM protein n=1 Tax=Streptomyces sp. NPDC056747 TaxID=3345935 RepID=UPI0036AA761A
MAPMRSKTILISEPQGATGELQFDNAKPYFPYMWAILKSYWERHGDESAGYEWLEPIWRNDAPNVLLDPYRGTEIGVLGLSCYTWNWEIQCELAREVKELNPDCLVVAGGPEPDYKDPEFFAKHPYIDAVAIKDGEITFREILVKAARGDRDFSGIGGLYLPGGEDGAMVFTGPPEVPNEFEHSPYLDQAAYYDRLVAEHGSDAFEVIMETNRGCPYGCSFCDWGSNTNSKVRRFGMERVAAEIDWLGHLRIESVMLADANFGILPRDLEIADKFNEARDDHEGYPKYIFYSAAKNNPDRAIEIAMKFAKSGICTVHSLSVQHTNKEVLAATARKNISADKQVQVVKHMMDAHVPVEVQLIQGIPGDTYDMWKGCLADLMEWGIHEDYLIQAYRLLPNAPAGERAFLEEWQVETIDRITYDLTTREIDETRRDVFRKPERILASTKSYTREDWVRTSAYSAFIKALHNSSATQRVATYLRLTHGVPYRDFYESLLEDPAVRTPLLREWQVKVLDHYQYFLTHDDASDHIRVDELPSLAYTLHPSRWLYIQVCLHLERFYEELKDSLLKRYPEVANLASVIDYQRDIVIMPDYDRETGKVIATEFDWPAYFEQARVRDGSQPLLDEPAPMDGAVFQAVDRVSGERPTVRDGVRIGGFYGEPLEWGTGDAGERWATWVQRVAIGRSSAGMHNHKEFKVLRPQP